MNISQALSYFNIKYQILIGFIPILAILLFLTINSHMQFIAASNNIDMLAHSTEEGREILSIEKDITELQRQVLVYSYIGYSGVLRKIDFLNQTLEERFKKVSGDFEGRQDEQKHLSRLLKHYENYIEGFNNSIKKRNAMKDIKTTKLLPLENRALEIFDILTEQFSNKNNFKNAYIIEEIEHGFLKAKLLMNKFEETPDARIISETNDILDGIKAQTGLLENDNNKLLIQELQKSFTAYKSYFNELIILNRGYLQLVNIVLAGKASEIAKLSAELSDIISNRRLSIQESIISDLANYQKLYSLTSIIASLLGLSLAMLAAFGISTPVKKISSTLEYLSLGNADADVPGIDRRDEVGNMARAAEKFKDMALDLHEKETKLSTIMDNMVDGHITINDKGIIESYNKASETIFGYSVEDVVGKNVKMLMPAPYKDEHDSYLTNYKKTNKAKVIGVGREVSGQRKNGTIFPLDLSLSKIEFNDRVIFSGMVRDITERKRDQEALQQANAELEEFAYRTSHDLRSPLVSSIQLLNLASQMIEEGNAEHARTCMAHSQDSLRKLENLVKDILSLTQTKNMVEEQQDIDFETIIDDALNKFDNLEHFERLDIQKEISVTEKIHSKKSRITLIVENLISNAIKYQDLNKEKPYVKILVQQKDGNTFFEVEDNGIGIPEDQQDNIFQMFKRFHPKTAFGSGLGLYMLKKSTQMIDGKITYNDNGQGSTFTLTFPTRHL